MSTSPDPASDPASGAPHQDPLFPNRLPPDNHVHTQWSWDTGMGATMEGTCARAVELGLPALAFTEHVDFTAWADGDELPPGDDDGRDAPARPKIVGRERILPLDVEGYLASVQQCRDRFPELRILTGMEAGEPHRFAGSLSRVLASAGFDRVLGSLHAIVDDEGRLGYADRMFATLGPDEVMRRYFTEMLDLINGSDAFQVLAHCDYPRRYWPSHHAGEYGEKDFEEEYRAVFRVLAASGRALEINTRSPLWSAELMTWWYDEGGPAVSFGSDAHHPLRVGARFDLAVQVVEAAGFRPGRDPYDFWRR